MTERFDNPDRGASTLGLHNEWQRLAPLLDALLDAPPEQRDIVARELSDGVETVYADLHSLAADCERRYPLLERSAAECFPSLLDGDPVVPDLLAERYRITKELGHGGMARVYLARDLKHSRDVAVKVLRPELGALIGHARFLKEIEIVAHLRHPHIVPLYDSGESDGLLYYVMPYEEGLSLRQRLGRDGPVAVSEAIAIVRDVCEALTHAHAHGIVHRDIKPDNVLLAANHALVADFGIARLVTDAAAQAETQTVPGMVVGTPAYMAPEQTTPNAPIDHRADIYALGVVAYELLVGQPPFSGDSYDALFAAHRTQQPPPVSRHRPHVPAELDALIMRCLAKQPDDRWQSADEILARLGRIAAMGAPSVAVPPSVRRWRRPLMAAGLAGFAMLAVAVWWWRAREPSADGGSRVAVVRFRNDTNVDSLNVLGSIIADVITNGLGVTGAADVVPAAAVMAATVPQPGSAPPNDLRSIARATGADIIVTGSYLRLGDSLAIQAEIIDVAHNRTLSPIDLVTVPYADQQRGIVTVRERVAVALSGRLNPQIRDVVAATRLPMSMAAYREYAEALDLVLTGEYEQGLPHAYRAIQLDSTSTSALLLAALMEWGVSGDLPRVDSLLRRVERFKTQLPPYDLAEFDWLRAYLDGDLGGVLNATRRQPDLLGGGALVQANVRLNRLEDAYPLILDVIKRPGAQRQPLKWEFLTQILHTQSKHDQELKEARKGLVEVRTGTSRAAVVRLQGYEIRALAALGRMDDLRRALDELHTLIPTSEMFESATRELRWHGHSDSALVIGRLAERWYREALTRSSDRRVRILLAQTLFEIDRWDEARKEFEALAAEKPPASFANGPRHFDDFGPAAYLGIDAARRGDTAAANAAIKSLVAFDGPYRFGDRQYWQAQIAAQLGQCEHTVELLRESLKRGTSVYDALGLEALPFKRVETCRAFQEFRDRPG